MDEHRTTPTTDNAAGDDPAAGTYPPPAGNYDPAAPHAAYGALTDNYAPAAGTRRRTIRLHRSRDERMIAGVCGGLAETLGIDVVILRLALVLATLLGAGAGAILYVACWILMPSGPPTEPTAAPGALAPAQGGAVEPAPSAS
jgi:phage shock protein C